MANIKIPQEKYDELLEAKHILESLVNICGEARNGDVTWTPTEYYRALDALIVPYKNKIDKKEKNG